MWIAISAVAVAVLVAAAFMGLGRFGEMPQDPVTDRPKGHVPAGPVTAELLTDLRIPLASTGYRPAQVDQHLAEIAAGTARPAGEVLFDVVRRGYDMQVVDDLVERARPFQPMPTPEDGGQGGANLEDAE